MQIHELTALARNSKASDIHISEGLPLMFRIDGHLAEAPVQLSAAETRNAALGGGVGVLQRRDGIMPDAVARIAVIRICAVGHIVLP